ncbi:MAG TPA: hypothetical protein VF765_34810 [Polyangiaceae bacterium]
MTPREQRLVEQWELLEEILGDLDRDEEKPERELGEERGRQIFEKALEEVNRRTAPPQSQVVSLADRRRMRRLIVGMTIGALAVAATAVATIAPLRRQVEAWFQPVEAPTQQQLPVPAPSGPPKPPEQTLAARAHTLREAAFLHVQEGYFHDASDELDTAQMMDPDGEQDPRVAQARHDITYGAPKLMRSAKTGLEYWEIPNYKPRPVQR